MPRKTKQLESVRNLWVVEANADILQFDEKLGELNRLLKDYLSKEEFRQQRPESMLRLLQQIKDSFIPAADFLKQRRPVKAPFWFVHRNPNSMSMLWETFDATDATILQQEFPDCVKLAPAQQLGLANSCRRDRVERVLRGEKIPKEFDVVHKVSSDLDASVIEGALSQQHPWRFFNSGSLYLFGTQLWKFTEEELLCDGEELRLLCLDVIDKERKKFERLRRKFAGEAGKPVKKREPISEDVQMFVWRRDEGKCVKCGSQERLEFDHIIPVSKGGSSTARNIQLLCERCNREKSDSI
jgi:hypothetical protein